MVLRGTPRTFVGAVTLSLHGPVCHHVADEVVAGLERLAGVRVADLDVGAGILVAATGWGWVLIGHNARRWGYAELEEDLYITRGALFRRLVVVPYGRMQYVDVQAGPLERAYGIARIQLHTASPGTSAHLPGLPADEAARLRDRLTSLGEAQAAGL